jgi:hypothetical protein
VCGV